MITKAYFVRDTQYVRYDTAADAADSGYPKLIAGNWSGFAERGFAGGIDAAVEWPNGKVYFFKGAQYVRYDIESNRIDAGFPLSIADQWSGFREAGFDSGIDAAVNWGNGKVYFFKADRYLRFDIASDRVDDAFPKIIAGNWPGFSESGFASEIDTAINWGNGKAYFFKGDRYVRYDIASDKVDDGFPARIADGWPTLGARGFTCGFSATWSRAGGVVPGGDAPSTDFSRLSDDFFRRLIASCGRLSCAPEDMLGVMESESGVDPTRQNPHGQATGLIQFMPSTLKGLGFTDGPDVFKALPAERQLDFVERFYRPHVGEGLSSAGRLYQATFLPATLPGSDESTVIAAPGGPNAGAFQANKLLDTNHDGQITVSDLTARIDHVRQGGRWTALLQRLQHAGS